MPEHYVPEDIGSLITKLERRIYELERKGQANTPPAQDGSFSFAYCLSGIDQTISPGDANVTLGPGGFSASIDYPVPEAMSVMALATGYIFLPSGTTDLTVVITADQGLDTPSLKSPAIIRLPGTYAANTTLPWAASASPVVTGATGGGTFSATLSATEAAETTGTVEIVGSLYVLGFGTSGNCFEVEED